MANEFGKLITRLEAIEAEAIGLRERIRALSVDVAQHGAALGGPVEDYFGTADTHPANKRLQVIPLAEAMPESTGDGDVVGGDMIDPTAVNDMLISRDGITWTLLPGPDADYKVLQRNADDRVDWNWVRAH